MMRISYQFMLTPASPFSPPFEGGGKGEGGRCASSQTLIARKPYAFTLIELLVTMGIIAIIAAITLVGIRAVTEGSKIASARNTVTAVLDNARGLAMKENTIVMVAFRAKLVNDDKQVVEAVTAKYAGDTYVNNGLYSGALIDRFVPIQDVPARDLPEGIKIAGPHYMSNNDYLWLATSDLLASRPPGNEMAGAIVAVVYGPDGNTLRDNPRSDATEAWVDFNPTQDFSDYGQVRQRQGDDDRWPGDIQLNANPCDFGNVMTPTGTGARINGFYCQRFPGDEPYVIPSPFLAVFDDEECRTLYDISRWSTTGGGGGNAGINRIADQSEYINAYADRIHFNRYTGVVMK